MGDWVGIASDNTDNEYKKREGERTDERDTYCRRERQKEQHIVDQRVRQLEKRKRGIEKWIESERGTDRKRDKDSKRGRERG